MITAVNVIFYLVTELSFSVAVSLDHKSS